MTTKPQTPPLSGTMMDEARTAEVPKTEALMTPRWMLNGYRDMLASCDGDTTEIDKLLGIEDEET